MKRQSLFLLTATVLIIGIFFFRAEKASAAKIESLKVDVHNDFVLEPGKSEIFVNPGDTITKLIYVTSRIPGSVKFKVEVEDVTGSLDPDTPVVILKPGEKGPYSGKDFITPDTSEFTLTFGERITIPVQITIPKTAPPGGYYSSVLISNVPAGAENGNTTTQGAVNVVSRAGTLFFIRVNGQANESGQLKDFKIDGPSKFFYNSGPFTFNVLFQNNGNVHLIPYGRITIKNIFGRDVTDLPVDAYFSLPDSLRSRQVTWDQQVLFGRYTAVLELNRGYNNQSDTKTIVFWVIPWKLLIALFAVIFVIIVIVFIFLRTFEIKRK